MALHKGYKTEKSRPSMNQKGKKLSRTLLGITIKIHSYQIVPIIPKRYHEDPGPVSTTTQTGEARAETSGMLINGVD